MKNLEIRISEEPEVWDRFVCSSPQGTVFMLFDFIVDLSIHYELVTLYDGDEIVAVTVVFFNNENMPQESPNMFMFYQGIILKDYQGLEIHSRITHEFKILTSFLEKLTSRYDQLSFCNSWRLSDIRPFQWHNYHTPENGQFEIKLRYTGIIDLEKYTDFKEYLSKIRILRRREWKKASVEFVIEETNDVDLLLDIQDVTYKRQEIELPKQLRKYRHSIVDNALRSGYGKMMKATGSDGTVDSVKFFLYDDVCAYYLFGGNNPNGRGSGASTFLMLNFIKDAMEKRLKYVDFCGVNSPNRGDYKISFNAELKPYFVTNYIKGRTLQIRDNS